MNKKHSPKKKEEKDEMSISSLELHGVSSLFEISKLDEDTVNWETMGSFVPVAPKEEKTMNTKLSPQHLDINSKFLHYIIKEKLGAGGMGLVYRAFDTKLERDVALKILFSEEKANKKDVERFQQEAKAIAKLNHPNIVNLHEIGKEPQNYFAMEYVTGTTLKNLRKKEDISPRKAAQIVRKVAIAIDEAHKNGVIHRDLKPSNIMIDDKGQLKVLDFGIAKLANRAQDISKTNDLLGTLLYMSPEQAQNEPIDFRTDVYSLGATLYEILTGRPPFEGDSQVSVYYQLLHQDPECPTKLNGNIPKELAAITLKCLEKKSYKRYRYMSELVRDLENFLQNRPVMARSATKFSAMAKFVERNKAFCGAMAGVACIVVAFIAAGYSMHKMQKEQGLKNAEMDKQVHLAKKEVVAKDLKIQETLKEKEFSIAQNMQLTKEIEEHKQKIVALRNNIKVAKQKKQKKRVFQLNRDLIDQINLKNELIKIAKLKTKQQKNVVEETQKKANKIAIEKEIPKVSEAKKEESNKKEVLAKNTKNPRKGQIPVPRPDQPTPDPGNGDNGQNPDNSNGQNPNDPEPKKPEPLLVSAGELRNTLPTAGKNKFPIKADVISSALSGNGERFLLGYNDGNFVIGQTESKKRHTLRHGSGVSSMAINGSIVLTGAEDGTVKIWDTSQIKVNTKPGKIPSDIGITANLTLNEHFDPIAYVAFSPNGKVFYTGSKSKPLRTWNAITGELLENTFVMNPVLALSIIEEKQQVQLMNYEFDFEKQEITMVTFFGKTLSVWRGKLNEETLLKEKSIRVSERSPVTSIAICDRSGMVITGHTNGKLELRDLNSFRAGALEKHESSIRFISFSKDNNVIISASSDDVELWGYTKK